MVSAIDASLAGLRSASRRLEVSAANIANATESRTAEALSPQADAVTLSPVAKQSLSDSMDTATALTNMLTASYDYKANLKAIVVADRAQKSLLDILA